MSGYGRQIILTTSMAVVIAVAIGAGVYYLQPQLTGSSSSSTSLQLATICSSPVKGECGQVTNSKTGLALQLGINSTEFGSGSPMLITLGEFNTLSTINNVTVANNYPIPDLYFGSVLDPFGIAIFKGNYAMSNVSKVSPLTLYQPGLCCPAITLPQYYIFQPKSYNATGISVPQSVGSTFTNTFTSISTTYTSTNTITATTYSLRPITDIINGYYNSTLSIQQPQNFTVGTYTIVGGDEWGSAVFLHFQIVPHQVKETGEYQVTFEQIAACKAYPPAFWAIPWSVTIGNQTMVQPAGTSLPLNSGGPVQATFDESYANITFSLPNGTYSYVVSPSYERGPSFFTPYTGNVTVAGLNVTVPIDYTGTSCTEMLTTTNSSAS